VKVLADIAQVGTVYLGDGSPRRFLICRACVDDRTRECILHTRYRLGLEKAA
jgi:hypothetical protein